jgi:hypothetical protein
MGTYLKMPMAGRRYCVNSNVTYLGGYGNYWASTPYANAFAKLVTFTSSFISLSDNVRADGYSIRPFKNEAVQPDTSRTKLY